MQIEVKWVRAGVGLPAVWMESDGLFTAFTMMERELDRGGPLKLSDPQTAFGLALKLDEWERAHNPMWPCRQGMSTLQTWVDRVTMWASTGGKSQRSCIHDMVVRAEEIGQDHHIRRSLGWEIKPGTLAVLKMVAVGVWFFIDPDDGSFNRQYHHHVYPDLAGVTCLVNARRIIAESRQTTTPRESDRPDNLGNNIGRRRTVGDSI